MELRHLPAEKKGNAVGTSSPKIYNISSDGSVHANELSLSHAHDNHADDDNDNKNEWKLSACCGLLKKNVTHEKEKDDSSTSEYQPRAEGSVGHGCR